MALFRNTPATVVPRAAAPSGLPIHVAELLFSKMSHDLASPAGAVENGLELLEEDAGDMQAEALKMVRDSAHSVASRLKFYRLSYGTPGGISCLGEAELRRIVTDFYASNPRLTFTLETVQPETSAAAKKLLLNLILCAGDSLVRGGTITAAAGPEHLIVTADSTDSARPPRTGVVVTGPKAPPPAELTAHTVQGWYTGWYAWKSRFRLSELVQESVITLAAHARIRLS
jgi:histidine phosphotransferase ChpT